MIIRPLARRPAVLHALATAPPATCRTTPFIRSIHHVPTLNNHSWIRENGIPGLLSPQGFDTAYTQYQQHILDELNVMTAGKEWENQETKSLVIEFSRNPTTAYAFNVASMAFNNHFFFQGISTNPDVASNPSSELLPSINDSFSSLETLRETFLTTAEAMFGPGFVWLVQTNDTALRPFRILPTYLAGSPLSGAHYRRQTHDLNTHSPNSYQELNGAGAFGSSAKQEKKDKKPLGGVDVVPLLCVNTWEHVWLHDYGIRGKRQYLEAWWDKIDWEKVRQAATTAPKASKQFHYT